MSKTVVTIIYEVRQDVDIARRDIERIRELGEILVGANQALVSIENSRGFSEYSPVKSRKSWRLRLNGVSHGQS